MMIPTENQLLMGELEEKSGLIVPLLHAAPRLEDDDFEDEYENEYEDIDDDEEDDDEKDDDEKDDDEKDDDEKDDDEKDDDEKDDDDEERDDDFDEDEDEEYDGDKGEDESKDESKDKDVDEEWKEVDDVDDDELEAALRSVSPCRRRRRQVHGTAQPASPGASNSSARPGVRRGPVSLRRSSESYPCCCRHRPGNRS